MEKRMVKNNSFDPKKVKTVLIVMGLLGIVLFLAIGTYLSLSGNFGMFGGKKTQDRDISQATLSLQIEKPGPNYEPVNP